MVINMSICSATLLEGIKQVFCGCTAEGCTGTVIILEIPLDLCTVNTFPFWNLSSRASSQALTTAKEN